MEADGFNEDARLLASLFLFLFFKGTSDKLGAVGGVLINRGHVFEYLKFIPRVMRRNLKSFFCFTQCEVGEIVKQ